MKKKYLYTVLITFVSTLLAVVIGLFCVFRFTNVYNIIAGISAKNSYTAKLESILKGIEKDHLYDVDVEKAIDEAIKAMLESVDDPYTFYLSAEEYQKMTTQKNPSFVGIGVTVNTSSDDYAYIINEIYENSHLLTLDIKPGDRIIAINGTSVTPENKDTLIDTIAGEEGTTVNITFKKADNSEVTLDVERRTIRIPQAVSKVFEGDIGYIRLRSFQKISYDDFTNELTELNMEHNIKALIIDLRGNGGGYKDIALKLADLFVPEGLICQTVNKNGVTHTDKSHKGYVEYPFVILVDKTSASASELFAGAVQDHGTGKLIGTTTYGKGIVQYTYPLSDGSYYQCTAEQWLTPNGRYIQGVGLTPDIVVELDSDIAYYIDSQPNLIPSTEYDLQLKAALDELAKEIAKN